MAISTYTELKAAIALWLNRDDLTSQIPDFITLAEATLNRSVRDTLMISHSDVTVAAGTAYGALPSGCLDVHDITNAANEIQMLEPQNAEQIRQTRRRNTADGVAVAYWINGRRFHLCPTPLIQTTYTVSYFSTLPPLASNSTNWLLTIYPDIYLVTSLLHAAAFLKDDVKTQLFSMLATQQISTAIQQNEKFQPDEIATGATLMSPADVK